jgi:hypothetical protein
MVDFYSLIFLRFFLSLGDEEEEEREARNQDKFYGNGHTHRFHVDISLLSSLFFFYSVLSFVIKSISMESFILRENRPMHCRDRT